MSTVLNDRDAILQAAGTRIVNPKNADIMLDMSAPAFHVNAAGVADIALITITGMLVGLEGPLSWSVQGATLSDVTDRSATVTYASMQGATAIITASMMSSGELFSRSRVLATMQDGLSGANAKTVKLTPSEQVFKIGKAGANSPASITLTATGQNTAGVPSFTIPAGTATLTAGANASQKVLTFANMATDAVTVEVTLDGQKDRVTIYKVREGQDGQPGQPGVDAVVGLLTNESVTLPAGSNGVVSSFSSAVCTMVMYKGAADDSANWTYAFAPASAANRLSYTASGSTVTLTGMASGVDSSYVDLTASKAGASSVTKRFFVSKSKAGASVTGARGAGQYYVVGSAWSDIAAQAACPGGPVVNDQVTISNGTVTYTKRWDGSVWYVPGAYLSGDLFVDGDINGSKLKVGTVQVTTPAGVPVVTIGGLQAGFEAPGTKNSEQQWADVGGTGKPQNNATNGAPAGTSVGGTEAGLLASRALNGDTALNAVNNATTGLAAKLSAAGNQNLVGPIALTANGAIVVGNTTTGVVTNTSGITLRKNGKNRVVMGNDGTFGIFDENGSLILGAESSLAQQAASNPNLAPNCRAFTVYNASTNRNGDPQFGDGQYLWLPDNQDGRYTAGETGPLGIPPGAPYTVSFDVYCTLAGSQRSLWVDLVGDGVDTPGLNIIPTTTRKRYKFTETMPNVAGGPGARLRIFSTEAWGGIFVVANIKVELGTTMTPWNDSVITNENAKSRVFIQNLQALAAYMGNVEIGAGGSVRQGQSAYDTGLGFFLGAGADGNAKLSMASGSSKILMDPANNILKLINPQTETSLNISLSFAPQNNRQNTFNYEQFTVFANISGASGGVVYQWSCNVVDGDAYMVSDTSAASCTFKCRGQNTVVMVNVSLIATDSTNVVVYKSLRAIVRYGNAA